MFKNKKGFTLIEMLIVLMIISILIILIVPNLGEKSREVNDKGCEALVAVVQAQVDAYYLEKNDYPEDVDALVTGKYITDAQTTCPNSENSLSVDATNGKVTAPTPSGQ